MTYGFTSSEKKVNELVQGDFRNDVSFDTDFTARQYEEMQHAKQVIMIALHLAKNKGGGQKSRQTLLEYLTELTSK